MPHQANVEPVTGTWRHVKSGGFYQVVIQATQENDGSPLVVYRSVETNVVWVRPLSDFLIKFELFDSVCWPWSRMKSAPKDGTAVLALLPDSNIPRAVRWCERGIPEVSTTPGWYTTWDYHLLEDEDAPRFWTRCPPDPHDDPELTARLAQDERMSVGAAALQPWPFPPTS